MKTSSEMHHELADWIRQQVRKRCARIKLLQRVKGVDRVIGDWLLTPKVDPDRLTGAIAEVAMREAEKLPESSLYGAFSYRSGESRLTDRKLWRIALGGAHPDEKASAAPGGVVAQRKRRDTAMRRARKDEQAPEPPKAAPRIGAAKTKRAATSRRKKPTARRRT